MLSFVTQYHPLVSTLKEALMEKRNLLQNLLFPTRKENHGKDVKDQHTVSPVQKYSLSPLAVFHQK